MISSSDILNAKILIVDDQFANVVLLERMLQGAGYASVTSTMDANEVNELHAKNHYDLILLDLEMPGAAFSGFQVMKHLKEIEPGDYLPVIVVTAHPGHKLHALEAGAVDFICKPFELPEVLARVHNMLEVRLLHNEMKSRMNATGQCSPTVEPDSDPNHNQGNVDDDTAGKVVPVNAGATGTSPQERLHRSEQLRTLLYVENNPASMKLVEQIIARYQGVSLLTAVNGKSGVKLARSSLPDVILMDIVLPDINGFEALKLLHADSSTAHIPVIAISVNATPPDIAKGLKAGFFLYLSKPINAAELLDALDVALEFSGSNAVQIKH